VVDPIQDVTGDLTVDDNAPTPAPIDSEVEAKLTSEILRLWGDRKNANTSVRRTRAELKSLRLALAEKLHAMKQIMVGTGRGGGWASYLRAQKLPLTTADRLVAQHEATLAPREEKLTNGGLPVSEGRQLALKMLPKLRPILVTAELVHEFIAQLFWDLDAAEGRETDDGLEVFRTSHEDATAVEGEVAELADPAPAA
jgi:hypothetical protein